MNHYLKQQLSNEYQLNWLATSLNPYYEQNDCYTDTLIEDCFIEQTFDNWYFGTDNSGNIQQSNFHRSFKNAFERKLIDDRNKGNRSSSRTNVNLITGDGGMRNIEQPELQEINSFNLILNEAMVALNCLSNGGCLILKVFSFFECRTVCLIYSLVCLFEKVHLFKPVSSKEGNSEIYLVCINYLLNKNVDLVEQMTRRFNRSKHETPSLVNVPNVILFKKEIIPAQFLDQLIECANLFSQHQTNSIERNIYLFEKNDKRFYFKYKRIQAEINAKFRRLVNLRPIKIKDQIIKKDNNQIEFKKGYYYYGLNRKLLIAYGTSASYTEMKEELNSPDKKLTGIHHLIGSVYLKSKKEFFDHFNRFHQFNHSSRMVFEPEKYIEQAKQTTITNKTYSNTKLCCENLIKLSSDYDSLHKPICIDNRRKKQLNENVKQNEQMVLDQFRSLFSMKLDEVNSKSPTKTTFYLLNHIQTDKQNSLLSILSRSIKSLKCNFKQLEPSTDQKFKQNDLVLHLVDLINMPDKLIQNDEHCMVSYLALKLNEIIDELKFDHSLVITLPSLYSRYAFGFIYLCTCIFKRFTISPIYLQSNDLKSGLIFVFTNSIGNGSDISNSIDDLTNSIDPNIPASLNDLKSAGDTHCIEINNNIEIESVLKYGENEFKKEHELVKNAILRIHCYNLASKEKQILDFVGIHRLMRESKYIDFLKLIILANNLNLIETIKLKMDLSS